MIRVRLAGGTDQDCFAWKVVSTYRDGFYLGRVPVSQLQVGDLVLRHPGLPPSPRSHDRQNPTATSLIRNLVRVVSLSPSEAVACQPQ